MVGVAENLNVHVSLKLRCSLKKKRRLSLRRRKRFCKRSDFLANISLRCGNFILAATVPLHYDFMLQACLAFIATCFQTTSYLLSNS